MKQISNEEYEKYQCCGMPLNEDGMISKETDGSFNEEYCKWCYTDGEFA